MSRPRRPARAWPIFWVSALPPEGGEEVVRPAGGAGDAAEGEEVDAVDPKAGVLPPHDSNDVGSRRRFMAYAGLLLSGLALIATVRQTLPLLFFATCE